MLALQFIVISILSIVLFYYAIGRWHGGLIIFLIWQILSGSLVLTGLFEKQPYLFPVLIGLTALLTIVILRQVDSSKVKLPFLLGIHVLRIPVEIVLYQLYGLKLVPRIMTFEGWNFDIVVGLSALLLSGWMIVTRKPVERRFFIIWNCIGLVFLLFIVMLAILSSPLPIQQFAFDQPNLAVMRFPYSLLPTCVVPIVLMSHILLIRSLRKGL